MKFFNALSQKNKQTNKRNPTATATKTKKKKENYGKIEIELFPLCAISHKFKRLSQIFMQDCRTQGSFYLCKIGPVLKH